MNEAVNFLGTPGQQVRYARPASLSEALQIASSVEQAEMQERRNGSFYVETEKALSQDGEPEARQEERHVCRNCTREEAEHTGVAPAK